MHIITGNKFLRKLKQFFKYIYRFTFRNEKLNVFEKNSEKKGIFCKKGEI